MLASDVSRDTLVGKTVSVLQVDYTAKMLQLVKTEFEIQFFENRGDKEGLNMLHLTLSATETSHLNSFFPAEG